MKSILGYIYYRLYSFAKLLRGNNPEDSATLYITWIFAGIILPPSTNLFIITGKRYQLVYYVALLIEGWLIHKFNIKFIRKKIDLDLLVRRYSKETLADKVFGHIITVALLTGSFILGFFLLSRI